MRITSIDTVRLSVPLRLTFRHARASRDRTDSVLVRVRDDAGHAGYGECAPRDYVTGETPAGARNTIDHRLAPPWIGASFDAFGAVVGALRESHDALRRDEHAACCALELAILDLAGRVFERPVGLVCGPRTRGHVYYSGVIPAADPAHARTLALACRRMGLPSVKIKVGTDRQADDTLLAVAREALGPECAIRVDANGVWTPDEAIDRIAELHAKGGGQVEAVEQPVAPEDLTGLARVAAASPLPIVADESLVSWPDGVRLIEARAAHIFNIRLSKNGGLLAADRLRRLAVSHAIPWMLGAQVGETAILSAAGRHFATHAEPPRWCEGSFGALLLTQDVAREDLTFGVGGRAPALDGHGLGITIPHDFLDGPGGWRPVPLLQEAAAHPPEESP